MSGFLFMEILSASHTIHFRAKDLFNFFHLDTMHIVCILVAAIVAEKCRLNMGFNSKEVNSYYKTAFDCSMNTIRGKSPTKRKKKTGGFLFSNRIAWGVNKENEISVLYCRFKVKISNEKPLKWKQINALK